MLNSCICSNGILKIPHRIYIYFFGGIGILNIGMTVYKDLRNGKKNIGDAVPDIPPPPDEEPPP